jgi:hypothetical protein
MASTASNHVEQREAFSAWLTTMLSHAQRQHESETAESDAPPANTHYTGGEDHHVRGTTFRTF